ncbi:MAG: ABC1 kinase family protein [Thermoplasmatota archaeon]
MALPASALPPPESIPRQPIGKITRSVEIAQILYRNDFFGLLRRLTLAQRRRMPGGAEIAIDPDIPRKVRLILEELGPTFVKIGQLLGTRPDLLPKPFVDEFKNLYDKTTPSPFPAIRRLLESELGRPLEEMFLEFDEVPVASASIGQVHFAKLRTGELVAVKIQHPDIEERVVTDFAIMEPLVRFIENLFAASRIWQPRQHLLEVRSMLAKELDYRYEARNHQRVYRNFRNDPSVRIPKIYWEYTARRVLVLERIVGVKFSDFDDPKLRALDGRNLARIITRAMAKQIFEDRIFHADPSPGNLIAIDSSTVAFLDFGAVGSVTRRRGTTIIQMMQGFLRDDIDTVTESLFDLCNVRGEVDHSALERDVERIMDYYERERASPADPVVLEMMIEVARHHDMLLPPDFMLITRALFQFEGLCRKLDPDYELLEVLEPFVHEHVRKEIFGMGNETGAMLEAAKESLDFIKVLPARMNTLMRRIERNELRFKVDMGGAREQAARDERQAGRTAITILVGAALVGLALVLGYRDVDLLLTFVVLGSLVVLIWAFVMLYLAEGP